MGVSLKDSAARVLGRYVLHSELASGGMATVHLGRLRGEAGFTRTVAIKRLHPQFAKDPDFVAMFVDEARMAARIRHPNVVPTLDVITDRDGAGETFLVMEYVAGESLSRLLRALKTKNRLVPPRIAATILAGVLHGLHAAHEAKSEKGVPLGMVHRDVSPQNVLVGTDGIAHVLDFGVAKASGRLHTTREGELKGKLAYMAPEQLESGTLTRQSDVYAAAVVLWETLTLRRLFEADSEGALLMQVMGGKILPPSTFVPGGLPAGFDAIILRGLARDPATRWATARDFALALEKTGQIAPASEIGEWVQSIAGSVLNRRAELVAEIEGGSMSLRAAPMSDPPKVTGEAVSQVSSIALSSSDPAEENPFAPPPRQARNRLIAGGVAVVLVALLLLAFRLGTPQSSAAASTPEVSANPAQPAAPRSVTAAAPPATGTVASEEAPAPAPALAETKPPSAPAPTKTPPAIAQQPRPAPPPPKAAPHPDCDPPFTRDANGHKHYKLQCL
jgi:serine/threonine protein kinase